MILKGSQRSGVVALANHLMNDRENDHVTLHSLRGFVAEDLHGALREAYAISRSTKCRQFLFSVSVNPPQREAVSDEQLEAAIDRIEEKIGLTNFQRAVVIHEKEGRRHAHVVYSRINLETMRAINLPHFKRKLMDVSRELFIEHGFQMPDGLKKDGQRSPLNFTLEEWQQARRAKVDPRTVKRDLQECWSTSDSAQAFSRALESRGYVLAKGDQRGHVAIDWRGEVYAIARWTGQKTKDVRSRLGEAATLPNVEQARAQLSERLGARLVDLLKAQEAKRISEEAAFAERRKVLVARQRQQRAELLAKHEAERLASAAARQARLPRGLKALWWRVTGKLTAERTKIEMEAKADLERQARVREQLIQAQLTERRHLQVDRRNIREAHDDTSLSLQIELEILKDSLRKKDDNSHEPTEGQQRGRRRR